MTLYHRLPSFRFLRGTPIPILRSSPAEAAIRCHSSQSAASRRFAYADYADAFSKDAAFLPSISLRFSAMFLALLAELRFRRGAAYFCRYSSASARQKMRAATRSPPRARRTRCCRWRQSTMLKSDSAININHRRTVIITAAAASPFLQAQMRAAADCAPRSDAAESASVTGYHYARRSPPPQRVAAAKESASGAAAICRPRRRFHFKMAHGRQKRLIFEMSRQSRYCCRHFQADRQRQPPLQMVFLQPRRKIDAASGFAMPPPASIFQRA
jgi:hypothetical protein